MTHPENTPEEATSSGEDTWQPQTEAQEEALRQQAAANEGLPPEAASSPQSSEAPFNLPPASFPVLVMMLTSQTLAALGLAPGPDGTPMQPHWTMAKHFIDTLEMLEEKTKGNLDEQESRLLMESLTELRLAFVSAKKKS